MFLNFTLFILPINAEAEIVLNSLFLNLDDMEPRCSYITVLIKSVVIYLCFGNMHPIRGHFGIFWQICEFPMDQRELQEAEVGF